MSRSRPSQSQTRRMIESTCEEAQPRSGARGLPTEGQECQTQTAGTSPRPQASGSPQESPLCHRGSPFCHRVTQEEVQTFARSGHLPARPSSTSLHKVHEHGPPGGARKSGSCPGRATKSKPQNRCSKGAATWRVPRPVCRQTALTARKPRKGNRPPHGPPSCVCAARGSTYLPACDCFICERQQPRREGRTRPFLLKCRLGTFSPLQIKAQ